jgi:hypothetical protein
MDIMLDIQVDMDIMLNIRVDVDIELVSEVVGEEVLYKVVGCRDLGLVLEVVDVVALEEALMIQI